MNTNNEIAFLLSKELFMAFAQEFKQKARDRDISSGDLVIYNLLRGLPLDRGFTPITRKKKLANGADAWLGFKRAKSSAKWILKESKLLVENFEALSIELAKGVSK